MEEVLTKWMTGLTCKHGVVAMAADAPLGNQRDRFVWGLHQNGLFSVNSMYRALLSVQALPYNTLI
jgi:hypothetical protein